MASDSGMRNGCIKGLRSQKRYSLNSSLIIDSEAIKIDPMIEMDYTQIARIILFYTTVLRVWGRGCVRDFVYHECPTLPSAQPPPVPGSSYTRVWIQMLLLMPQKFNIPTLKIRPSIADAIEHNQTRSPCHPHARHATSTPHAAMTPCTQERACEDGEGGIA